VALGIHPCGEKYVQVKMLLSLSNSERASRMRGVLAVREEPCHVSVGECGVMLASALEL